MLPIVNEALTATQGFVRATKSVLDTIPNLQDEQYKCEQAIMDIEHYIEFNKLSRTESVRLARKIKEYRLQRREIKDTLEVLQLMETYFNKNVKTWHELQSVLDRSKNYLKKAEGERRYNPRVLYELFGQEPPETALKVALDKAKEGSI